MSRSRRHQSAFSKSDIIYKRYDRRRLKYAEKRLYYNSSEDVVLPNYKQFSGHWYIWPDGLAHKGMC